MSSISTDPILTNRRLPFPKNRLEIYNGLTFRPREGEEVL